jgi:hypothetical protein
MEASVHPIAWLVSMRGLGKSLRWRRRLIVLRLSPVRAITSEIRSRRMDFVSRRVKLFQSLAPVDKTSDFGCRK